MKLPNTEKTEADKPLVPKYIRAGQDDGRTGLSGNLTLSELALLCLKELAREPKKGAR